MSSIAQPPFRADHVGSLLRPADLHQALARAARGEVDWGGLRVLVGSDHRTAGEVG